MRRRRRRSLRRAARAANDKKVHEQGLVSVLKQIHDDLDAAVAEAYGWQDLTDPSTSSGRDEQILQDLVALNAERVEEERRAIVRWLRPEFQNPGGATSVQGELPVGAKASASCSKRSERSDKSGG